MTKIEITKEQLDSQRAKLYEQLKGMAADYKLRKLIEARLEVEREQSHSLVCNEHCCSLYDEVTLKQLYLDLIKESETE